MEQQKPQDEIILRPRQRLKNGNPKPDIPVDRTTYDNMVANDMINNFTVVSTLPASDAQSKYKKIVETTEKIEATKFTAQAKTSSDIFKELSEQYRAVLKSDPEKAAVLLKELAEKYPKNTWVKNQIKKQKNK